MQPGVNFGVTDKNVEQLVIVRDAGPAADERRWLETPHLPGEHISDASLRPDYLRCARIVLQCLRRRRRIWTSTLRSNTSSWTHKPFSQQG